MPRIVFLASCSGQETTVQDIDSFAQAQAVLNQTGKNSLVVFDVDETLIYSSETIVRPWFVESPKGQKVFEIFEQHAATKKDTATYIDTIISKMLNIEQSRIIEPAIVSIIQKLQERGVKVIALTNCMTGKFGIIPSMQAWRFEKLASLGINLSTSFEMQEIILNNIQAEFRKNPLFYKGILLTDRIDKGKVLAAFLDAIAFKPDQIIFFDDDEKNVESVKKVAIDRGIPYHGFVYKAAAKLFHQYDQKVIDFQLQYIIEHDDYIPEQQARQLLQKI